MGVIFGAALTLALLGQSRSWIPPTCEINDDYLQTAKRLLGTHLGDTRALPYMKLEVELGDLAQETAGFSGSLRTPPPVLKVEGWLMRGIPSRAVLWDGVDYPVHRVLGLADLRPRRKALFAGRPAFPGVARYNLGFHRDMFAVNNPAAPALWLLAGDIGAAELALQTGGGDQDLMAWFLRRYLTNAFYAIRSNKLEDALAWLGRDVRLRKESNKVAFGFRNLPDDASDLIEDLRERLSSPKYDLESLGQGDVRSVRAELASVRYFYAGFGWGPIDPAIDRIVARKDAVVPALLQLRHLDNRFTLAGYPSRNFPGPSFAPISLAANYALEIIWREFPLLERKSDAELVELWKHQKDLSTTERLAEVLEDESLPLDSARNALYRLAPQYGWFGSQSGVVIRLQGARFFDRIARAADRRMAPILEELAKPGSGLSDAKAFLEAYGAWDHSAARSSIHAVVGVASSRVGPDRENPGAWDALFDLIGMGLRNGDPGAVNFFADVVAKHASTEHWFRVISCSASGSHNPKVDDALRGFIRRTQPRGGDARETLIRLTDTARFGWEGAMSRYPFRDWLNSMLSDTAYELAEGGPEYQLSPSGRRVAFKAPRQGPKFIRLCVADVAAQILTDKFDTEVAFDFFGSEDVKAKQRRALQDWLRRLPEGHVKEYQFGQTRPSKLKQAQDRRSRLPNTP